MATMTALRSRTTHRTRLSGDASTAVAGGILAAIGAAFLTVTMLGASIAPGYDFAGGAISDLGVISATALLFNGTLVAIGLANVVAGWLLLRSTQRIGALMAFVLAGIGAIGAGLFPLDTGAPHALFALVAFVSFNVEAIVAGRIAGGTTALVSAATGLLGLVFVVLMLVGDAGNSAAFGPIGHGGTERMIVYPAMLWLLAFGGRLTASAVQDRGSHPA